MKVTYDIGDVVKYGPKSLGIILPDNKIFLVMVEDGAKFGMPRIEQNNTPSLLWPLEKNLFNKQDYSLRFAFVAILTVLGVDASWIDIKGTDYRNQP